MVYMYLHNIFLCNNHMAIWYGIRAKEFNKI